MRASGLFLACLASAVVVVAQTSSSQVRPFNETAYDALPDCAQRCVGESIGSNYCSLTDTPCFCSDQNVTAAFATCLSTNCDLPTEILAAQNYQATTCNFPHRSRQDLHRSMLWFTFSLATLFILLRLVSRAPVLQGSGYSWDDYLIFFTYALAVAIAIATEFTLKNGSALDEYWLTPEMITQYMLWTYISEVLYNTIIITTKIAVILLYLRIWSTDKISRPFRIASWLIILSLVLTGIAFDFGLIFQCWPVTYIYRNIYGGPGQCLNLPALTYTFGAISICYDVLVFFLPIHSLLKLKIAWQKKVGVCAVFLVGFVVTICTIVRLQYLVKFSSRDNATWVYQPISMWSIIEANLSIMCCCMPAAVGLFQRIWKWSKGEPIVVSTQTVSKQSQLTSSDGQSGSPGPRHEKYHTDEESSSDDQSRTRLVDLEQAPALGEQDGRARKASQGPGQVDQFQTTTDKITSASAVLEKHKPQVPARDPGRQTALVHQASSNGGQKVEISHEPPSKPSKVELSYRDADDVVHQVTLTDVPVGKIPFSSKAGSSSRSHDARDLTGLSMKNAAPAPQSPYATK